MLAVQDALAPGLKIVLTSQQEDGAVQHKPGCNDGELLHGGRRSGLASYDRCSSPSLIHPGEPEWLCLVVLWGNWNANKFVLSGLVSVFCLGRVAA